jgi:hypothetical protein
VLDDTRLVCHPSNKSVTCAVPTPACSGTRTGPWKTVPQQNCARG